MILKKNVFEHFEQYHKVLNQDVDDFDILYKPEMDGAVKKSCTATAPSRSVGKVHYRHCPAYSALTPPPPRPPRLMKK
jgi:hypothetical protein